jgi:hypothetical protein
MSVLKVIHMVAARNFDVMPNKLKMKNIFLLKVKKKSYSYNRPWKPIGL